MPLNRHHFQFVARQFRAGKISLNDFTDQIVEESNGTSQPENQGNDRASEICVDLDRANRCGFPEVVYGEGKTVAQIVEIAQTLQRSNQSVLVTRIDDQGGEILSRHFDQGVYSPIAKTFRVGCCPELAAARVAVVTAGTSDFPIAEEASETLKWMGINPSRIGDVGVAGPTRLEKHLPTLQSSDAIVVIAGFEGALPSVVAGHVGCPVIAVPTSVGYGTNMEGVAALLTMLNGCAANVSVVNIDAGFKAAYVAGLIASRIHRVPQDRI